MHEKNLVNQNPTRRQLLAATPAIAAGLALTGTGSEVAASEPTRKSPGGIDIPLSYYEPEHPRYRDLTPADTSLILLFLRLHLATRKAAEILWETPYYSVLDWLDDQFEHFFAACETSIIFPDGYMEAEDRVREEEARVARRYENTTVVAGQCHPLLRRILDMMPRIQLLAGTVDEEHQRTAGEDDCACLICDNARLSSISIDFAEEWLTRTLAWQAAPDATDV